MTKIIEFPEGIEGAKKGKKIDLVYSISNEGRSTETHFLVSEFDFVTRIREPNVTKNDRMEFIICWDDDIDCKQIFLGHWNDGVV